MRGEGIFPSLHFSIHLFLLSLHPHSLSLSLSLSVTFISSLPHFLLFRVSGYRQTRTKHTGFGGSREKERKKEKERTREKERESMIDPIAPALLSLSRKPLLVALSRSSNERRRKNRERERERN